MRCLFFSVILFPVVIIAQPYPLGSLEGHWEGALIRTGNSIQSLQMEVIKESDSVLAEIKVDDWYYQPARESNLKFREGVYYATTPYGEAQLILDTTYQELTGTIPGKIPPLNIHLKRQVPRPVVPLESREISVKRPNLSISGTLYWPRYYSGKLALAIMVHGRGCSSRYYSAQRAQTLAQYGIACFAYDKRGSAESGFPCEECNHELITNDLVAITKHLRKLSHIDEKRVGYISNSAGGWIVPDAAQRTGDIAFLITTVGPSTSVYEQQIDGLKAFAERDKYSEKALEDAIAFTKLSFETSDDKKTYALMQDLLGSADSLGWRDWLADSDIPASAKSLNELWARRFTYDPTSDLIQFKGDFLSILGEKDPVVPAHIQKDRLDSLFAESGKVNYEVKTIPEAGHGLNQGSQVRKLDYNPSLGTSPYYYKFYRPSFGGLGHIVEFLEEKGYFY